MDCKLENDAEQRFRKTIIYGIVRDYGVAQTAVMCGLREDQTDLIYKYSNQNNGLDVPDKRWRVLSQSLTKRNDLRIIREYAHPEVLVVLKNTVDIKTNGKTDDELRDMIRELSEVEQHIKENPSDALTDIKQMRGILDRYEAEIRGMQ